MEALERKKVNYNFDEDQKLPIGISVVGEGSVIAVG